MKGVRDVVLTIVLLGSLCEQLLDVLPILIGANLTGGISSSGGSGQRVCHLEAESLCDHRDPVFLIRSRAGGWRRVRRRRGRGRKGGKDL